MTVVRSPLLQALQRRRAAVPARSTVLARHRRFVARLQRGVGPPAAARCLPPLALVMRRAYRSAIAWSCASARTPSTTAAAMRPAIAPLVLPAHRIHTVHTRRDSVARIELQRRTTCTLQRVRERVQQRELRATTTRVEQRLGGDRGPAWSRLAMVPARPATPAGVAPVPRLRAPATDGDPLPARRPPEPAATQAARTEAVTLAAPELARVTDHVIHELDARVRSYRERTGRL